LGRVPGLALAARRYGQYAYGEAMVDYGEMGASGERLGDTRAWGPARNAKRGFAFWLPRLPL
jgi:hypothetical protein